MRARVETVYERSGQFIIWPAAESDIDGRIKEYNLADEGITWVRGFHERDAPELASLLAALTMR